MSARGVTAIVVSSAWALWIAFWIGTRVEGRYWEERVRLDNGAVGERIATLLAAGRRIDHSSEDA